MTASRTENRKAKANTITHDILLYIKDFFLKLDYKSWSAAILIVLALILANLVFMFYNSGFYYSQYEDLGVYYFVKEPAAKYATENLIDYMTFRTAELNDFFSDREKLHMKDVKNLIITAHIILLLLFAAVFFLFRKGFFAANSNKKILQKQLYAMVGIFVLLFLFRKTFGFFFILFHKIFFTNDYWLLDPTVDKMILLFPNQFFANATAVILARSLFLSALIAGIGYLISYFLSRRTATKPGLK